MSVDLRHFRAFVVVAEEGNVGRAAARLFITQPALSRQLQQLESHLGVTLLDRVPKGVELTDAGRELLEKARIALEAAEDALTIGRPAEPAGRLAVGLAVAGHRDRWYGLAEAFVHSRSRRCAPATRSRTTRPTATAPSRSRRMSSTTPSRFTRPDEVAALAAMLASDALGNVTGTNVTIDGGLIKTT